MSSASRIRAAARWLSAVEHWTAVVLAVVVVAAVGFGVGALLGITPVAKSPRSVVLAFYEAAQRADYAAAREYLSDDARAVVDGLGAGQWEAVVGELTRRGTITETEFLGLKNYGRNAVAGVLVVYDGVEITVRVDELARSGSRWGIEWPIGTRPWLETVRKYEPLYGTR